MEINTKRLSTRFHLSKKMIKSNRLEYSLISRKSGNGYYGRHRSMNSLAAIINDVVPISMIDRNLLNSLKGDLKVKHKNIFKFPVNLWVMVAKKCVKPEKHHTGKIPSFTNHYNLHKIAKIIDNNPHKIKSDYDISRKARTKKATKSSGPAKLAVIKIQKIKIFHGAHGLKIKDNGSVIKVGYVKRTASGTKWVICSDGHRRKLNANKVIKKHIYSNLKNLSNHISRKRMKKFKKFLRFKHILCKTNKMSKPTYNY